jgi:hypothetical protein
VTGLRQQAADPYAVLGLSQDPSVTDDDVRAAWRRIASATHPDRTDGGDPERFALAAAAYTDLRTADGRNEARAARTELAARRPRWPGHVISRLRQGRPARLLLRAAVAAAAAAVGVLAAPGPTAPALVVGAATWLILTARHDIGSP